MRPRICGHDLLTPKLGVAVHKSVKVVRTKPGLRTLPVVSAVEDVLKVRTPHSGYHDDGSDRRFFEGWYFKVTLPDLNESFAIMYSVEKGGVDPNGRVAAQVMGPGDGYIAQANTDLSTFWADRSSLALGGCFKPAAARKFGDVPKQIMNEVVFNDVVETGFQATDVWQQGAIIDAPGTTVGEIPVSVPSAKWAYRVRPVYGWGDAGRTQKSTAGWMSSLPVFEPHWQVLMAHGVADGWFEWGSKRYNFRNCPAYAEKNWGSGFPKKWAWLQCNSFANHPNLSITAVGAIRNLLNVPGIEEDVGMLGIHYQRAHATQTHTRLGRFIELVPWSGPDADIRWSVEPWGEWRMWAKNSQYEALIECRAAADSGTVLRAPTSLEGLAPACKDTFYGNARLRIWELNALGVRKGAAMVDAFSDSCAAEVGGGPWWHNWKKQAKLNGAVRLAFGLPVDQSLSKLESMVESTGLKLPSALLPPGAVNISPH